MDLVTAYMNRVREIINEIRAQLPALPEPQRSIAERHLAELARIAEQHMKSP